MNTSPVGQQSQAIKGYVLWAVAKKAMGPDGYTGSFLGDTGDLG